MPETKVTATQARADFTALIDRVVNEGDRVVLQRDGKDLVATIPIEEYEFLERTIEEAEDKADLLAIDEAKRDIELEGTIPPEQV